MTASPEQRHPEEIERDLGDTRAEIADTLGTIERRLSPEQLADEVLDYLRPLLEPVVDRHFHFTRAWMQEQAARIADPRTDASRLGRQLNLPPAYLLIHRVTIGSIGVLCQLDAAGDFRSIIEEWLPGFVE